MKQMRGTKKRRMRQERTRRKRKQRIYSNEFIEHQTFILFFSIRLSFFLYFKISMMRRMIICLRNSYIFSWNISRKAEFKTD